MITVQLSAKSVPQVPHQCRNFRDAALTLTCTNTPKVPQVPHLSSYRSIRARTHACLSSQLGSCGTCGTDTILATESEHMATTSKLPITGRTDPAKNARRAMVRPCPRCSAPVLTGLDDDWCAMTVAVDLAPLTNHTEALALISGRHTYEVTWNGPRGYHIDKRPHWHISNYPAGDKGYADGRRTIHAEHRCDTPITTNPELPPLAHHNTNSYIIPDKPPF